jgi:WD40 repeat protein
MAGVRPATADNPTCLVLICPVDRPGDPVGCGLLLRTGNQPLVLTCAHVVLAALPATQRPTGGETPADAVQVRAWAADPAHRVTGRVLSGGWAPVDDETAAGDLAVLQLSGPLPGQVALARLASWEGRTRSQFQCLGFPDRYKRQGQHAYGVMLGRSGPYGPHGREWVQLDGQTRTGYRIVRGFSGTPVWDVADQQVVGLVVSEDVADPDARVGAMIPLEVAAGYLPAVADRLPTGLRLDPRYGQHWLPRSQGLQQADPRLGSLFSGRTAALTDLVRWLTRPEDGRGRVVTGDPGSGKSSLLARLVVLSDPALRREHQVDPADPTVPPEGCVDVAIHAQGKTVDTIVAEFTAVLGITAKDTGSLLYQLNWEYKPTPAEPLVIVVDAVDEATGGGGDLARTLLGPLASQSGIRLIVGCRRPLLPLLGPSRFVELDLDAGRYLQREDLVIYTRRLLLELPGRDGGANPYAERPELVDLVARGVAERAQQSFLVAQLTARGLVAAGGLIDVRQPAWQQQLPADVGQAFEDYLGRFGPQRPAVQDLLTALAYAEGDGLDNQPGPHGQPSLWAAITSTLGSRDYTRNMIAELLEGAEAYLIDAQDDATARTSFRLFHQALVDHLRPERLEQPRQRQISDVLLQRVPRRVDGSLDWSNADDYTLRHLAAHAAAADRLDQLLDDPGFVVAADPGRLAALLGPDFLTAPLSRPGQVARLYRRRTPLLHNANSGSRAATLEMAAVQDGNHELAVRFATRWPDRPWRTAWAHWSTQADYLWLGREGEPPEAVVLVLVPGGTPLAVTATVEPGDEQWTLRCWDVAIGDERGEPLHVERGEPAALTAVTLPDGHPLVVLGDRNGKLHSWDLATGAAREQSWGSIRAVATVQRPSGAPLIVCGGDDGTLRFWDPTNRASVGSRLKAHASPVVALVGMAGSTEPLVVSAGEDGVRCWDTTTGRQRGPTLEVGRLMTSHSHIDAGPIQPGLAAVLSSDGIPTVISLLEDGSVHRWDLMAGTWQGLLTQTGGPFTMIIALSVAQQPILVAVEQSGATRCWNPDTGTPIGLPMAEHAGKISALAAVALDRIVLAVTCESEGMIRRWNVDPSTPIPEQGIDSVDAIALVAPEPSNPLVITGENGGRLLRRWALTSGAPIGEPLALPTSGRASVSILTRPLMPPLAVSGGAGGDLYLWDPVEGTQVAGPLSIDTYDTVQALAAGVLPDGSPVVVVLSGSTLQCWDLIARNQRWQTQLGRFSEVVATGTLASGHGVVVTGDWDGKVWCWDLTTGSPRSEPTQVHGAPVKAIATASLPDGSTRAISGGLDGGVWCWDLEAPPAQARFLGRHSSAVEAITMMDQTDGSVFAVSGSSYGSVRFWRLDGSAPPPDHLQIGTSISALAAHGTVLIVGTRSGVLAADIVPSPPGDSR